MNRAEAFQKAISIFDVLDVLRIEHHGIGTYQISCPNPRHEDTNPSARVYANSNTVYCWTCGATWDVVELVKIVKAYSFQQACDLLELKFGAVEYIADPRWMAKFKACKRHGFVTNKSVRALERVVHEDLLQWYRCKVDFPGPQYLFDVYEFCFRLYDELVALKIGNDVKTKLLKAWLAEAKATIERCADLSETEVRSELYAQPGTYPRSTCLGQDIQHSENARQVYRQCVQCFGNNRRAQDQARFLADRIASNG